MRFPYWLLLEGHQSHNTGPLMAPSRDQWPPRGHWPLKGPIARTRGRTIGTRIPQKRAHGTRIHGLCRTFVDEEERWSRHDLSELRARRFVVQSASFFTLNPMVVVLGPKTEQQIPEMSKHKVDVPT